MKGKKIILTLVGILILLAFGIYKGSQNLDKIIASQNYSTVIYDRNGRILRIYLNKDEQFILPPIKGEEIPEKLKKAVIAFEDKNFYSHYGIDPRGIFRAIWLNIKNGRRVSGGSTITMQTVKILRGGKRTYSNKIIEIFYSFILEYKLSKDEILKLYLSNVPYGKNIRGYRGAFLKYYGKDGEKLTWSEAASLAILPNSPSLITFEKNKEKFLKKKNLLLKRLYENGEIDDENYKLSIGENPPSKNYNVPQRAMFFSDYVKNKSDKNEIITTLDWDIQKQVESVVKNNKSILNKNNVFNTAILVVDTQTREILGYYGGEFKEKNYGLIDAVNVKRNVGSTLKPFLYGLSMDKGLISSRSLLVDIPTYYRSFSPVNSDKKNRGLVRATKALQLSLNIPMVRLLNEYRVENFINFFEKTKLVKIDTERGYGLSSILGTIEMSPLELGSLYTSLGNYGDFQPLKYILSEKDDDEKVKFKPPKNQLISEGAVYLTLNIMKNLNRPSSNWEYYRSKNEFYWKTGTSYGERDGWAVGTNKNYTIVVWTGNLDNAPGNHLSGIRYAAPMLFEILDSISDDIGVIEKPVNKLKKVEVTANGFRSVYDSGVETIEIPIDTVLKKDPYEKRVFIDLDTKKEVDSRTWTGKNYSSKIINDYGKDVNSFLEARGDIINKVETKEDIKIKFLYPSNGMKIKQPRSENQKESKVKVVIAGKPNTKYSWYINKKKIRTGKKTTEFFNLSKGKNVIMVISENGEVAKVKFWVE